MRAIEYRHTGAASDVLRLVDLPEPHPGRGEVRVRVRFSGVNPGDDKKRADWAGFGMPFPSVVPLTSDAGRTVETVAAGRASSRSTTTHSPPRQRLVQRPGARSASCSSARPVSR